MTAHVLLLAGTAEARDIARLLSAIPALRVTASLAGVTSEPAPVTAETRCGGFGGAAGLARWLSTEHIAALVDATHPYAARMAGNAATAAAMTGTPHLRLLRPAWACEPHWQTVPDLPAAAAALPAGARVLLTTGRKGLEPFLARTDLRLSLRVIEPLADLPSHVEQIAARPPFSLDDEVSLLRGRGITHIVSKNSGGSGRAKLDAAARLGLAVLMVARPAPPTGPVATTPEEAVAWVMRTIETFG